MPKDTETDYGTITTAAPSWRRVPPPFAIAPNMLSDGRHAFATGAEQDGPCAGRDPQSSPSGPQPPLECASFASRQSQRPSTTSAVFHAPQGISRLGYPGVELSG